MCWITTLPATHPRAHPGTSGCLCLPLGPSTSERFWKCPEWRWGSGTPSFTTSVMKYWGLSLWGPSVMEFCVLCLWGTQNVMNYWVVGPWRAKSNRHQQVSININRYQQIAIDINKYLCIFTNINKYPKVSTNIDKYQSISTNRNRIQTNINNYQQIYTNINIYQQIPITINKCD